MSGFRIRTRKARKVVKEEEENGRKDKGSSQSPTKPHQASMFSRYLTHRSCSLTFILATGVYLFCWNVTDIDVPPSKNSQVRRVYARDPSSSKVPEKSVLELALSTDPPMLIRMLLLAPNATSYVKTIASNGDFSQCNIYRAEPVPSYWGSKEYPDRYFDGGRWGPPYALVQGQIMSNSIFDQTAFTDEGHRPMIERGMVAWAGGKGHGPHFFIALADHPEWKHAHTVWAKVLPDDMPMVDSIVTLPLKHIPGKNGSPDLSNLQQKIDFALSVTSPTI